MPRTFNVRSSSLTAPTMHTLDTATQLAKTLAEHNLRVVFSESCTAGLVAASLARVPGVSEVLCGSAVTYREATKQQWLGVSSDDLQNSSAVSEPVARQMALGVLERTPEADIAASITGHLGPNAPTEVDGVVLIGLVRRVAEKAGTVSVTRHALIQKDRVARQQEAAELVLRLVTDDIRSRS